MSILFRYLMELIASMAINKTVTVILATLLTLIILGVISYIVFKIVTYIIQKIVTRLVLKTKSTWDDILLDNNVFSSIAHIAPAAILYSAIDLSSDEVVWLSGTLKFITEVYFTGIFIYVTYSLLNSVLDIYNTFPSARSRPIKGYLQLIKIIIALTAIILFISVQFDKNPLTILGGLGAMAAVVLLVFKDSILGFVASIQLTANNMVKLGDWIELPKHGADGTIEDISLTTVKVQNWDKTITTVPTYALVENSVKNWKGMEESGGRRIKRALSIDISSIKFCSREDIDRLSKISLISDYVMGKESTFNSETEGDRVLEDGRVEGFGQTNIGIFRRYIEQYLAKHPLISNEMTFIVRQLQSTDRGLPIEIYVFSKRQEWPKYEAIQSDIFDHILAIAPIFDIRIYQSPTGNDIKVLSNSIPLQ